MEHHQDQEDTREHGLSPHTNLATTSQMSGSLLILPPAEGPLLVHQENLIAQAYTMECNQVLSAQPIDGKKQFWPPEIWSLSDEVIHHQPLIRLKHVQHSLVRVHTFCAHDLFLLCHHIADYKRARSLVVIDHEHAFPIAD